MEYNKETYNKMLESVRDEITLNTDLDVDTDSLTDVLSELGIQRSNEKIYKLILWNDHVNDMMTVVVALYEICKLSNEDCVRVMMEAHNKGKAVAKTGEYDELKTMKNLLNQRNLEVTIEE